MFKKVKDIAVSKGVKVAIDKQIKEYGKMLKFNLDSKNRCIELEVMLEGESEPVTIIIDKYELTKKGDSHFITLNDIKTSRAWMNTMASLYLEGKSFAIPTKYAHMLKIIV